MAKKKHGNKLPPFVPLTWDVLNSKAYKDLTASASKALPYFLGKIKTQYNDPQKYDISFSFPYDEAKRYGFSTATYYRTICVLIEKGFIDPYDKGGLRSTGKSYNLFTLSKRWIDYGKPIFKAVSWKTFEPRKGFEQR